MTAPTTPRTITDPVVMFDSMWEAADSLRGRLLWLKRHAATPVEADIWFEGYRQVRQDRAAVSATDIEAQYEAMLMFRAREQELAPLVQA